METILLEKRKLKLYHNKKLCHIAIFSSAPILQVYGYSQPEVATLWFYSYLLTEELQPSEQLELRELRDKKLKYELTIHQRTSLT